MGDMRRSARRGVAAARAAAIACALAALLALAPSAGAARQVRITADAHVLRSPGPALWDVLQDNDATICSNGVSGPIYTPVADGQMYGANAWHEDGFDYGLVVAVGGTYYSDPDGRVRVAGETVRAGQRVLSGLRVSRSETALGSGPALRSLVKLRNPSANPVSRTVWLRSDLGTDGNPDPPARETVFATSSGDQTLALGDRWVVSGEAQPTPYGDPVVTHVLAGRGARAPVSNITDAPGPSSGCLGAELEVTVPARSTRYLLFFAEMNGASGRAVSRVGAYDRRRLSAKQLSGIPDRLRGRILNWDLR